MRKDEKSQYTRQEFVGTNNLKTAAVLLLGALFGSCIAPNIPHDDIRVQNVLMVSGLLLAGCISGAFAVSYGNTATGNPQTNFYCACFTTFFLNLGIFFLLSISLHALQVNWSASDPFVITAFVVYLSIIGVDYWKLLRYLDTNEFLSE